MARSMGQHSTAQNLLVVGGIAAAAGATAFLLSRKSRDQDADAAMSEVPAWTLLKAVQGDRPVVGKTLLINRRPDELYAQWKNFPRFSVFMENVRAIERDELGNSRWTIQALAGTSVTLITRIRQDIPDRKIAWESLPESDIKTKGQVEFQDAGDRGTLVSLVMSYDPPAGRIGQFAAKLFAREPNIQVRHDLRRFKQLMETGEVTTNASPSARKSESPTESRL